MNIRSEFNFWGTFGIFFLLLLLTLTDSQSLYAQSFSMTNGRNHPELSWKVAETEHFIIGYPEHIEGIEEEAAAIAEETYDVLSDLLNVTFDHKIRIFLSDEDEIANGFAVPFGREYTDIWVHHNEYAEGWTGNEKWMRKVLSHELAHIFHFQATESTIGLMSQIFSNPMPRFWTEGLAQYTTEKWDSERGDRTLRLAVFDDQLSYTDGKWHQNGRLLYALGNAQTRFLADEYGDEAIAELLAKKDTTFGIITTHDFYDAFEEVTEESYSEFNDRWRKHMNIYYNTLASGMERTDSLGKPLSLTGTYYYDLKRNPMLKDSLWAVHLLPSLERPVRRLVIYRNKKEETTAEIIDEGGFNRGMSWSRDGSKLVYSKKVRGNYGSILNDLFIYNRQKDKKKQITFSARAVYPVFGSDNETIYFVKSERGVANLHQMDLKTKEMTQLTSYENDAQIVSLAFNDKRNELYYSLFDEAGTRRLKRYSLDQNTSSDLINVQDNRFVVVSPDGDEIAYTSLRDDVPNVFRYHLDEDTERRVTNVFTGAMLHDWTATEADTLGDQLIVQSTERKEKEYIYAVSPDRKPFSRSVSLDSAYTTWTTVRPEPEIPSQIAPDPSLITERYNYRPLQELTHGATALFPLWDEGSFGLAGLTLWTDPLGKHTITAGGFASMTNFSDDSYGVISYINGQLYPTISVTGFQLPGAFTFYGSDYLVERQRGVEVSAFWPLNLKQSYASSGFYGALGYTHSEPLNEEDFTGITALPLPQAYDQTQWNIGWQFKKQRPYRWNVINPLDGFGLKGQLYGATDVTGTDASYSTIDLSAFTLLPGLGTQRFYLYGRAQAQFGDPLPQQRIGFTKYDNVAPAIATQQQPYLLNLADRVRGYRSFIMGEQVVFGTIEYRSPFLPGLATQILGIIELGRTDLALFADAGWVGNVQFSSPEAEETRLGTGLEVKNVLSLFGVDILQSVGWGYPYDHILDEDNLDLYYRIRASVAF